ncbi:hypothetical protein [Burkholderia ambifaria]|uniref:hypothetical protein n=1 Tax=Burkholderia ambifaria TaxID=152480 RepID=UPI00158B3654|nr:hypothetical protein [Burkholderia ambifaria]MBR8347700.1 hypothetical protein [Burkholderia ambifaria]
MRLRITRETGWLGPISVQWRFSGAPGNAIKMKREFRTISVKSGNALPIRFAKKNMENPDATEVWPILQIEITLVSVDSKQHGRIFTRIKKIVNLRSIRICASADRYLLPSLHSFPHGIGDTALVNNRPNKLNPVNNFWRM